MSALWADNPIGDREPAARKPTRTLLRPVTLPRQRLSRVPFVLVLIAIFGIGMAGLLMLNTTLQNQAFQSNQLNLQATQLTYNQAALARQVEQTEAPQELARRASQLGLRPNPYPAYLNTADGKITGYPHAVSGNEDPTQIVKTPEQLAAEAAAAKAAAAKAAAAKAAAAKAAAAKAAADKAAAATAAAAKPATTAPSSKPTSKSTTSQTSKTTGKKTTTSTGRN